MSSSDRQVGIGDPELERARTIHAAEVERLAEQYLPPHEAQRKALVTLLDTLGYGAAAAVVRAGIKGGYISINTEATHEGESEVEERERAWNDALEYQPAVIIFKAGL